MKKYLFVLLGFISFTVRVNGQTPITDAFEINLFSNNIASFNIHSSNNHNGLLQPIDASKDMMLELKATKIMLVNAAPFITFATKCYESVINKNNTKIEVRFSKDSIAWENYKTLQTYAHNQDSAHYNTSELLYLDKNIKFYQLKITTNRSLNNHIFKNISARFFSPGNSSLDQSSEGNIVAGSSPLACNCAIPTFTTRVQWNNPQGANMPGAVPTTVSHLIVHHSDGSNTSSDWAATVRAIFDFHVNTNGWSDIGYNWLVAPDGRLFEGRRANNQDITGAHFCGYNANTMGVCMLGSYTSTSITNTARNTLIRTLAWKCCDRGIDPTTSAFHSSSNLTIRRISGHRDGCATSCPGNTFYPTIDVLRSAVNDYMNSGCTLTSIKEIEGLKELTIYPNPSSTGRFEINMVLSTPKKMQFKIVNAEGKTVFVSPQKTVSGRVIEKINSLSQMPKGIYYIELTFNKQKIGKTIIK